MTRNEYRWIYYEVHGTTHLRKEFWVKYREVLMNYQKECVKYYIEIKGKEFMNQHEANKIAVVSPTYSKFGNCTAATPVCYPLTDIPPAIPATPPLPNKVLCEVREHDTGNLIEYVWKTPQEKGNNPMRIETTNATAYITAPKSDDAASRDYLFSRLAIYESWRSPKLTELSKLFKLDENGKPKSYLQLIDAIKNGKYTLDDKAIKRLKNIQDNLAEDDEDGDLEEAAMEYGYGPFYGIVFTDLPKADQKGYDLAVKELNALVKTTKDTIMVMSPAEGLSALQALEAWTPAGKAN